MEMTKYNVPKHLAYYNYIIDVELGLLFQTNIESIYPEYLLLVSEARSGVCFYGSLGSCAVRME